MSVEGQAEGEHRSPQEKWASDACPSTGRNYKVGSALSVYQASLREPRADFCHRIVELGFDQCGGFVLRRQHRAGTDRKHQNLQVFPRFWWIHDAVFIIFVVR